MMKTLRVLGLSFLLLLPVVFGACQYDLVKDPTHNFDEKKNAADYKDYILPPSVITASNGLSRTVELEWEEVPNAVQYQIYSAPTPYDSFQKISETKSNETNISIDEESGITKYYCICAVNYFGTVSSKSIVVSGSTLAVPIITEITPSEEGTCVTVNWWMDNCNENTYQNTVSYNISVYKSVSSNVKVKDPVTVKGNVRSVMIENLEPKTEYFFTIEVVNTETADKEISTKTSALTAHRVIPDPPKNVEVSQGDSVSKITISWTLPDEAWYRTNEGSSGFELHPVYFKIFRKEGSHDFELLAQQKYTDSYTAGIEVSYEDTNVERGKQYEYYIQSYTDNVPAGKEITADSSKSPVVKGWLISEPKFYIESNYTKSEDELSFTNITFNPKLSFEPFGIEYKYVLGVRKVDLVTSAEQNLPQKEFNSVDSVNDFIYSFDEPAGEQGYYYYTLYIYPSEGEESFVTVDASGKYTVTADVDAIPRIDNFVLRDGFSQKFELSWDYNPDYVYTIHWKDGENGEEQTEEIDASYFAGVDEGDSVTYSHTAVSGDCRIYTLEASAGISTIVRPNDDTGEVLYKTLGTPDIKIVSYEYDKIKVEWNAVQKACATYTVSAHYENDNTNLVPEENRTKTIADDVSVVSFEISQPDGYNDATKSGKPIILSVIAASETQSDSTTGSKNVYTLGPALTNTKVSQVDENVIKDAINVEWERVQGAQGYLIKRICYKKGKTNIEASPADIDTYYFDGTTLSITSEPVDSSRAYVTPTEKGFVLTDIAKEVQDNTKSYEKNQSRISWGVPFDYFIIPVKADGIEPEIEYTNIPNNYIATYGYGLNLQAEKSDSSTTQVLEWDPPYIAEDNYPSFYYREAGSNSNSWTKLLNVALDSNKKKATFKPVSETAAYEYLVAYNKAFDSVRVPDSFLNDTEDVGLSIKENRTDRYAYANENDIEKANKGYLLAVSLNASTGTGYSETVSWSAWDYQNRKIGPDSAELFIKNYNISDEWKDFAVLNKNLQYSDKKTVENTTITKIDDVQVSLEPTQKMDKDNSLVVTPGYLQVLRDAKHYYKLDLIRGETTCTVGVDANGKELVKAYRNITNKELVKCALLNIAYGFYLDADGDINYGSLNGQASYKEKDSISFEGVGSASFGARKGCDFFSSESGKYKADVTLSGFAPNMLNPGGTRTCVVKVTMNSVSTRTRGLSDPYLDKFRTEGFTVSIAPIDDNMPPSYNKNLTMTCTGKDNLTIKIGSETIVQATNENDRRIYFPIQLFNESEWWFKDSSYGWWPNEN